MPVRHDIIQMIHFGTAEPLKQFCRGIQFGAPVDSYVTPEPWDMPGYDCPVIMAAGAFIQGASIELSCDAPCCRPIPLTFRAVDYESGKAGNPAGGRGAFERQTGLKQAGLRIVSHHGG